MRVSGICNRIKSEDDAKESARSGRACESGWDAWPWLRFLVPPTEALAC
jgi:hypothetical protein